jgi:regulator of sigma E protease
MLAIAILSVTKSVIAIIAVFVVSIIIHEFGHYYVAKKYGVAVPAFAIGFGPKLVRWMRRGTEFSIRLFPIGGMVQLAGEVPQNALFRRGEEVAVELNPQGHISVVGDPSDVPNGRIGTLRDLDLISRMQMTIEFADTTETFRVQPHARLMTNARNSMPLVEKHEQVLGKPLWQRAAIILAGPFMNFLLAGILFSASFMHTGVPQNRPYLGEVIPNSPAQAAGLREGDEVLAVNGHTVNTWIDLVTQIRQGAGKSVSPVHLKIDRAGDIETITVHPKRGPQGYPMLGVDNPISYNKLTALRQGFTSVYTGTVATVQAYVTVFKHHQFQDLAGPVGIAGVISQGAQTGFWTVLAITAFLSLNLGFFNLLPIPALDGGRLLFMIVEAVRGRGVDPNKEGLVHLVGFALLMLFAVAITYRDVTRLF